MSFKVTCLANISLWVRVGPQTFILTDSTDSFKIFLSLFLTFDILYYFYFLNLIPLANFLWSDNYI